MPVVRVDNYLDAYRLRGQADDPHVMAARGDRKDLTEFVNRRILETINLVPGDKLLDIGCGDGSLLNMAAQTTKGTGVTASEDERKKLSLVFPELTFIAARVQGLPISAKTFSKIVCNATLFYLPAESDVRVALSEIARVAQPGATIWIGEIPEIDEYAHKDDPHGRRSRVETPDLFSPQGYK